MRKQVLTIAAVGDIHCTRTSAGTLQQLFVRAAEQADILLLCGDLTDYGLPEEARILAKEIPRSGKIPLLAVFGNHDFESGHQAEVHQILTDAGILIMDGDHFVHEGLGFAGVKGFGGGFGRRMLEPWGETVIKSYVHEAVEESLKLERALSGLSTPQKVVLMHYSPIEQTVEGEPRETYPFLGSSRLEEPLNRYGVTVAFHGHAHMGAPEGTTRDGISVYNVSAPVLHKHYPEEPPFRLYKIEVESPAEVGAANHNGS